MDGRWLLAGVALLALLASGGGSGSMRASRGPLPTPAAYGRGKVALLRGRYAGELGAVLRGWVPVAMPGGDVCAVLGFTSIGMPNEDTAPVHNPVFHEIGEFQTPAGPAQGPAPNPDPMASYNHYGLLGFEGDVPRASADVRAVRAIVQGASMLGRGVSMAAGSWRGSDARAVRDRAAMGLGDLLLGALQFSRIAPELLSREGSWNLWRTFVAFSCFSAGVGGALRAFARYRARLSAVPEQERFALLCELAAADVRAGVVFSPPRAHPNSCYTLLRGWQKLEAGKQLALSLGLPSEWFSWLPQNNVEELQRLVTAGAEGLVV